MFLKRYYSTIVNKAFIKELIQKPSNAILIDVREKEEVLAGSIPTSKHISVQVIEQALSLSPEEFKRYFGFEKPLKEDKIVFYCRSGKRSATASAIAERLGYSNIYDYSGSWLDWDNKQG